MGLFDKFKKKKEEEKKNTEYVNNTPGGFDPKLFDMIANEPIRSTYNDNIKTSTAEKDIEKTINKLNTYNNQQTNNNYSKMANDINNEYLKEEFDNKYGKVYNVFHNKYLLKEMGMYDISNDKIVNNKINWINNRFKQNIDFDSLLMPFILEKEDLNIELDKYESNILNSKRTKYDNEADYVYDIIYGTKALQLISDIRDFPAVDKIVNEFNQKYKKNNGL